MLLELALLNFSSVSDGFLFITRPLLVRILPASNCGMIELVCSTISNYWFFIVELINVLLIFGYHFFFLMSVEIVARELTLDLSRCLYICFSEMEKRVSFFTFICTLLLLWMMTSSWLLLQWHNRRNFTSIL